LLFLYCLLILVGPT